VSNRAKSILAEVEKELASTEFVVSALERAFAHVCNKIQAEGIGNDAGTTATVALVDSAAQQVWIAHVGDSTAIVIDSRGKVTFQSQDHKPYSQAEAQRLLSYGTQIKEGRVQLRGRPGFHLAISRSIGDFIYAQEGVTAKPDIASTIFEPGSTLVLASDGVWDVSQQDEIAKMLSHSTPQESAEHIVNDARTKWAKAMQEGRALHIDDITAVVVKSV